MLTPVLGYAATLTTTVMFLPQAFKAWKSKKTKDISISTYLLTVLGAILWFSYGFIIGDFPIMITNGVVFFIALFILGMKKRYG